MGNPGRSWPLDAAIEKSHAVSRRTAQRARLARIGHVLFWEVVLVTVGLLMVMPFIWMVSTSLKTREAIFILPPTFIPNPVVWENYLDVWTRGVPMATAYLNSLKVTSLVTVGTLINCSLAGYAFAKIKFRGRGLLFGLLLATMMVPHQVTLVPLYILMARIGWVDTHLPLIVPDVMTNAFGVFLLRQFFLSIPDDLLDAARIDGANPWQMFWRVALPLTRPALVSLAIFTMLSSWNSFLTPLIYLDSPEKYTVPLAVNYFATGTDGPQWNVMMAAITTALLPVMVVYLLFQRQFIQGVARTGLKG